jgi:hypothetical protein
MKRAIESQLQVNTRREGKNHSEKDFELIDFNSWLGFYIHLFRRLCGCPRAPRIASGILGKSTAHFLTFFQTILEDLKLP